MRHIWSLGSLTDTCTADLGKDVGKLRIENGKIYRLVQNKSSDIWTVGQVVTGYAAAASETGFKSGIKPATANLGFSMGIVLAATVAVDSYCWVQIYGDYASASVLGHSSSAIGDTLIPVDGQYYLVRSTAVGTAPIYPFYAVARVAYTTTSAAAAKAVFIKMF
jgi:hypothetical protein